MNFHLRPWQISDAENLVKYANNPNISRFLTDGFPNPYTMEHALSFIEKVSKHDPTQVFAIDVDGDAVGSIGLHPQSDIMRKNIELGYFLGEPFWGKGIITKCIKEIVSYGFQNFDVTRIYARPFGNNIASRKALEKAGFIIEAVIEKSIYKNDEFLDEYIFAIRAI
jgi:[ribosomal protein S5]-alanine N-acetyltransferase